MYIKKSKIPKKYREEMLGEEAEVTGFVESGESSEEVSQREPDVKSQDLQVSKRTLKEKKPRARRKSGGMSKKSKIIYGLLIGAIVIAVSVTLAVTFWTVSLSVVFNQLENQYSKTLSAEGKIISTYKEFGVKADLYLGTNEEYSKEIDSFLPYANAQGEAFKIYQNVIDNSITSTIYKKEINRMQNGLIKADEELTKMGDYIAENMEDITNATNLTAVWTHVRDFYIEAIKGYNEFYEVFNKSIQESTLKGMYGNDMFKLVVDGADAFTQTFANEMFLAKTVNLDKALNIVKNFNDDFVNSYFEDESAIRDYYYNTVAQEKVKTILTMGEKTENKVDFAYLIKIEYNVNSTGLSEDNKNVLNKAVNFLEGEG